MENLNLFEIGQRIRSRREAMGFKREYLAEQLDVSTKFCADIELGKSGMSLKTLINISKILRLSTDYIIWGDEPNSNFTQIQIEMLEYLKDIPKEQQENLLNIIKIFATVCNTE